MRCRCPRARIEHRRSRSRRSRRHATSSCSSAWARRCCSSSRNYRFRATSGNAAERRPSLIRSHRRCCGGSRSRPRTAARVLVDATAFFVRDAHGVAPRLRESKQGSFSVDESRSAVFLPRTKGFPKNTEVEVTLTFTSGDPAGSAGAGGDADRASGDRSRASFLGRAAPDDGYKPRRFDPRVGVIPHRCSTTMRTPVTAPIEQRWIMRHRLQKKDPAAPSSEAVEADRLLRRQRRAGEPSAGADRGRVLVESGVRGGRVLECASRCACCRRAPIRWTCATT